MRILKRWPDPPGEVQQFGKVAHSYLENRLKHDQTLPAFLSQMEPICQLLERTKGEPQAEYKYALNRQFQPVEFFAQDAWVRAVGDVVKVHDTSAFALDWKMGKYRDGDEQLSLQANVMFAQYPHVQKIGVVYAWVKENRTTVRKFDRETHVPITWQKFLPRAQAMEEAIAAEKFPPKPSGLCKAYCNVLSCEFNGRRA